MKIAGVCFYCIKKIWQSVAVLLVITAVAISLLKYTLPHIGIYRNDIQNWVFEQYGAQITIGNITAGWDGIGPAVLLQNIAFVPNEATPLDLTIKEVRLKLDFWTSLKETRLTSDYFILDGVVATVDSRPLLLRGNSRRNLHPNPDSANASAPILDAMSQLLLGQLKQFSMTNSVLNLKTPDNMVQHLGIEQLTWHNDKDHHQGAGAFRIDGFAANSLSFVLDLEGSHRENLSGQLYIEASELDISPWLVQFVSPESQIKPSNINFQSWTRIDKGVFGRAEINLGDNQIRWTRQGHTQHLSFGQGQLFWTPGHNGWEMSSNDIQLSGKAGDWPTMNFNLDKQGDIFNLYISQFAAEHATRLLSLLDLPESVNDSLASYAPRALVHDLYIELGNQEAAKEGDKNPWRITGLFNHLGWDNVGAVPGATELAGEFGLAAGAGWIKLHGTEGFLLTGELFKKPIQYENFDIDIALLKDPQGIWQLKGDNIWLHSSDIDMVAELSLSLTDNPRIEMYAEVSAPDLRIADNYYPPEYMGLPVINYLTGAVKAGKLDVAQLLWTGPLNRFPYPANSGIFLVNALISDVDFLFAPGWPVLSAIDGELLFKNDMLTIVPHKGYFLDIDVTGKAVARLPSLSKGDLLELDIDAVESVTKVAKLFKASPLRDIFNPVFEQLNVKDPVAAKAQIILPLEQDKAFFDAHFDVQGEVLFTDNTLTLKTPALDLTGVNGLFKFHNDKIWTEGMSAHWFDLPLQARLDGVDAANGFELAIKINADIDSEQIFSTFDSPLGHYVKGNIPLEGQVDLSLPSSGIRYGVNATVDLTNVALSLPAPYDKAVGIGAPITLNIKGDEISSLITGNFDQRLFFNGILPHDELVFSQAHLIFGKRDLGLAGDGFKISVDQDKAQVMPWYQLVDQLVSSTSGSAQPGLLPTPALITGKVGEVSGFGQRLNGVVFEVTEGNGSWDLLLNAKETYSTVHFDRDWLGKGISIKTDYLRLAASDDEEGVDNSFDSAAFIKNLPPMTFSCMDCQYGDYNLERLDIETSTAQQTLKIDRLTIDKGKHQLQATGQWIGDQGIGTTKIEGRLSSDNIGNLFNEYDLTSSVRDSNASMDFFGGWSGGPHQFNAASLAGEVKWQMGEGHLTEVSDRGTRLLSLLSFDSIVRKLKLDFRDVFSKGFFYNSMKGTMLIESGIAYTDDTKIDGVPADLVLKGSTNLVDQTLDYNLAFTPKYTSSLPTLIAFLVNPISGIAALGLNEVFESKVISRVHFTLTGTVEEPVITETDRKSRDIKLPEKTVAPFRPINPVESELPPATVPDSTGAPAATDGTEKKVNNQDSLGNDDAE